MWLVAIIRIYELELTGENGTINISFSGSTGSVANYGVVYYLK